MRLNLRNVFLLVGLWFATPMAFAQGGSGQNFTQSPFSSYGIGEWTNTNVMHSATDAHTHSGYYSYSLTNPATLGAIRYTTLDFSMGYRNGLVKSSDQQKSFVGGGLNYFSVAFPIWKKVSRKLLKYDSVKDIRTYKFTPFGATSSISIKPLTTVGYSYYYDKSLPIPTRTAHYGTGGLSMVQWNTGFRFGSHLNLGYGLGYVFGTTKDQTLFSVIDSLQLGIIDDSKSIDIRSLQHQFGALFNFKIDSTYHKLGLSYEIFNNGFASERRLTRVLEVSGGYTTPMDTVLKDRKSQNKISLPSSFGLGYSFQYRRDWLVSVDYHIQNWSKYQAYFNSNTNFKNRTDLGFSFVLHPMDEKATTEKKMKPPIRLGYVFSNSQQLFKASNGNTYQLQEQRFILGFGIPVVQRYYDNSILTNMVNVQLQYLQRGLQVSGIPQERYLTISIGLQLGDIWFAKRKYD